MSIFLLDKKKILKKSWGKKKKKKNITRNTPPPPPPENCVVSEKRWKNIVEPEGPQMTIWRMRIECWITKVTHIHSEYVTFVFPQQWLHERAPVLRYTHIACFLCIKMSSRKSTQVHKSGNLSLNPLKGMRFHTINANTEIYLMTLSCNLGYRASEVNV